MPRLTRQAGAHSQRDGVALCVAAACGYGLGPVLTKVVLASGMTVWTLLLGRLLVAALLLWAVALVLPSLRGMPSGMARHSLGALGLGALTYSAQLALFASSLERMSASVVVILFYTFPILVAVAAVVIGRERLSPARVFALALGVGGLALTAASGAELHAEPLGVGLALGSACACAGVVLGSDALGDRLPPLLLAALVTTGASIAFIVTVPLVGFDRSADSGAWILVVGIALTSGVVGTTALLAGIAYIGPSLASTLLTLELPVAVVLAWIVLGDRLDAGQAAGGGLILAAAFLARRVAGRDDPELEVPS